MWLLLNGPYSRFWFDFGGIGCGLQTHGHAYTTRNSICQLAPDRLKGSCRGRTTQVAVVARRRQVAFAHVEKYGLSRLQERNQNESLDSTNVDGK